MSTRAALVSILPLVKHHESVKYSSGKEALTYHNAEETYGEPLWPSNKVNELGQRQLGHTADQIGDDACDSRETV